MREEDIGIVNNRHHPGLTALESRCLDILQERGQGVASAIPARVLSDILGEDPRDLRYLINHLIITHEIPIICKAGNNGGYFLPESESEVTQFYRSYHKRAMTGLVKASRGRKASFVEIVAQLSLGFDEPDTRDALERLRLTPDEDPVPAWVQVVTKLLDRLSADPQHYADEIRAIQDTYGDIFIPREKVRRLRQETAKFQKFLGEIAQERS